MKLFWSPKTCYKSCYISNPVLVLYYCITSKIEYIIVIHSRFIEAQMLKFSVPYSQVRPLGKYTWYDAINTVALSTSMCTLHATEYHLPFQPWWSRVGWPQSVEKNITRMDKIAHISSFSTGHVFMVLI